MRVDSFDDAQSRFLFEYRHEGAEWAIEVRARDLDDAKARLRTLPWAQYRGEIAASGTIPDAGLPPRPANDG